MEDKRQQEKQDDSYFVTAGKHTGDFKESIQKATEAAAAEVAFWRDFWKEWMPGGMRKRKRYRTKPQGLRRTERRKNNKAARASRKKNRPVKKGRRK